MKLKSIWIRWLLLPACGFVMLLTFIGIKVTQQSQQQQQQQQVIGLEATVHSGFTGWEVHRFRQRPMWFKYKADAERVAARMNGNYTKQFAGD